MEILKVFAVSVAQEALQIDTPFVIDVKVTHNLMKLKEKNAVYPVVESSTHHFVLTCMVRYSPVLQTTQWTGFTQ
jgi:hypothetical protein